MRHFFIGCILATIGFFISLLVWGMDQSYIIPGAICIILIGLSMIFSGTMVSGDRMRANYATESSEDRNSRNKMIMGMTLIGSPNLILAIIIYII